MYVGSVKIVGRAIAHNMELVMMEYLDLVNVFAKMGTSVKIAVW